MKKLFVFILSLVLMFGVVTNSALANCPNPPGETFPGNPGSPVTPTNPPTGPLTPSQPIPTSPGNQPIPEPTPSMINAYYQYTLITKNCYNGAFLGKNCRDLTTTGRVLGPVTNLRVEWETTNLTTGATPWFLKYDKPNNTGSGFFVSGYYNPGWGSNGFDNLSARSDEFKSIEFIFLYAV